MGGARERVWASYAGYQGHGKTMTELANKLTGRFIVVDGPDGAGKSTQLAMLEAYLRGLGVDLLVTRDPGGTAIGDRIREILLDAGAAEMAVTCELMLYMASRAQLAGEVIRPALAAGKCVLCDRFVSATIAYQGAGGANTADILAAADIAIAHTWPDLTIVLDIDSAAGLARVTGEPDRMEAKSLEFHRRVREGFLAQAQKHPGRFAVVSGAGEIERVAEQMRQALAAWPFTT